MTLSNLIRRIRLAIGRLHVPHCEDCRNLRPGNLCSKFWESGTSFDPPADNCRSDETLCGKHGRYFEPKEGA